MGCECGQYMGCATRGNKVKWSAFAVLALLGAIFGILWISKSAEATDKMNDCLDRGNQEIDHQTGPAGQAMTPAEARASAREAARACRHDGTESLDAAVASIRFFWLMVLFWILASIPLYIMCCCTPKPSSNAGAAGRVPMEAHIVRAPVATGGAAFGGKAGGFGERAEAKGESLLDIEP